MMMVLYLKSFKTRSVLALPVESRTQPCDAGPPITASEAMDGFAHIEEDRIRHRRIVALSRFVSLVESAHLVTTARRTV